MAPGTSVKLGGTRNGKDFSLSVTLAERPAASGDQAV